MSTLLPHAVLCRLCGVGTSTLLADSINAERSPHLLTAVLSQHLHRVSCPGCGCQFIVEKELLYVDFRRGHFVGVFPPDDAPRFTECERLVRATFEEATVERAPPALAAAAARFQVRVVFGLAELREKLLCWLWGFDDRVVELLKLDVLADRPALLAAGVRGLRLDAVFADGGLGFLPLPRAPGAEPMPIDGLYVPASVYAEEAAALPRLSEAHRELLGGAYVNLGRYQQSAAPPPETARSSADRRIWRDSRP